MIWNGKMNQQLATDRAPDKTKALAHTIREAIAAGEYAGSNECHGAAEVDKAAKALRLANAPKKKKASQPQRRRQLHHQASEGGAHGGGVAKGST